MVPGGTQAMKKILLSCLILWAPYALAAPSEDERALVDIGKLTAWKLNPEAITQGCEKTAPKRKAELRAAHAQWMAANRDTVARVDRLVSVVLSRLANSMDVSPLKDNETRTVEQLRESFESADAEQRAKICANLSDF